MKKFCVSFTNCIVVFHSIESLFTIVIFKVGGNFLFVKLDVALREKETNGFKNDDWLSNRVRPNINIQEDRKPFQRGRIIFLTINTD